MYKLKHYVYTFIYYVGHIIQVHTLYMPEVKSIKVHVYPLA